MHPAQLQVVLFLEDQQDPLRLQGLIGAGVQVICRLELFQAKLLAGAINAALRNRPWLDPLFAGLIQPAQVRRHGGLGHPHQLPHRERELLRQVGQGYNALEISHRLGIRTDTVRRTLSRAYRRIGVRDRAQAVGWCLCHGLISRRELERRYRHQVEQGSPMEES
jgi:LuxR family quorum sensing-dependent transcriptional regulator